MENAADALKMAAAVLAFVLALGISMSSFSEVREVSEIILNYKDKEYNYSYIPSNGDTTRKVSVETIVQSIYRAYNENYKIYFYENGNESDPLILFKEGMTQEKQEINYIDLRKQALATVEKRNQFIGCILYGSSYRDSSGKSFNDIKNEFKEVGIILQEQGLYDKIVSSGGAEEKFGVYYEDDEVLEDSNPDDSESNVPQANRIKKRVITYILQ
ncbi:MAG: hypothetical protein ACLVA2_02965 [Clostridia bacterium]